MTSKTLDILDIVDPDRKAVEISNFWMEWDSLRTPFKNNTQELQRYIYATDTTTTTNAV